LRILGEERYVKSVCEYNKVRQGTQYDIKALEAAVVREKII
jgi:hypothetical protein